MNANGIRRFWVSCFAVALGVCAWGRVGAEVGVVLQPTTAGPGVTYIMNGLTEDPSPIHGIWRQLTPVDLTHVTLNAAGEANGDGAPSLISDADSGLVVAAWARNSANGFDVVVSSFAGGAWTTPAVVVGSTANELDPQLVLDPDGSVHLFYWVDGATPQVFHTVAPSDLSSWSTPVAVSQPGQSSCRPAAAFYNGILHVAYEVHEFGYGNSPREVVLAHLESGAFITEVVALTNNLDDITPQVHSHAGRLWVDWVDSEDTAGAGELAWTRLNSAGQWDTIRYEGFANIEQRDFRTRGGARLKAIE
jgi:hypothetical protein